MKKLILIAFLMTAGSLAKAQNISQLGDFKRIELDLPLTIELKNAEVPKADAGSYSQNIEFEVKNNTLSFKNKGIANFSDPVKVYFTKLNEIIVQGMGTIKTSTEDTINTDELNLKTEGAGKLDLNVNTKSLNLKSQGANKITLAGKSENFYADLDGAIKLNSTKLITQNAKIEADGASSYSVNAAQKLELISDGISKGTYFGNPVIKTFKVDGLSKITDGETGEQLGLNDKIYVSENGDTTKLKIGKSKIIIIGKDKCDEESCDKDSKKGKNASHMKRVYSGFEFGMQSFATNSGDLNLPAAYSFLNTKPSRSWFWGLNILEGDAQIIKNRLAVTSGFGIEFFNLGFEGTRRLLPNIKTINADTSMLPLTRNRMYNFNLNVPLLIKFSTSGIGKKREGFHFAAGVVGTYVAHSHLNIKSTANGFEEEYKIKDDFNINPFRLTATVRIGYGWLRLIANYSLTPYFRNSNTGVADGNGPDLRIASAGITLIPF